MNDRDAGESSASTMQKSGMSRKRKLSRKEKRKQTRQEKKRRRDPNSGRRASNPKATITASPAGSMDSKGSEAKEKGKRRKVNSHKTGEPDVEGRNTLFYKMLAQDGLIEGDGPATPEEDADDREIREMRKKLKLKGDELGEGDDGLDSILGYKDEAMADMKKHYGDRLDDVLGTFEDDCDNDYAELDDDNEDDEDEDIDENLGGIASDEEEAMLAREASGANRSSTSSELNELDIGDSNSSGPEEDIDAIDRLQDENESNSMASDGDSNVDTSDKESLTDESDNDIKLSTPAQYITRADAYGKQEGKTEAAKSALASTRYIPPARRAAMRAESGAGSQDMVRAARQVKGLLNRLNASNLTVIIKDLVGVYERNSRGEISTVITSFVLDACIANSSTLEHLLYVYAGGLACLHHMIGMEVTAHFVRDLATQFESNYKDHIAKLENATENMVVVDKKCTNLMSLLAYMYNFKIVHSVMIMGLLTSVLKTFNELDIELILVVLNISGNRLKTDDKEVFQALIKQVTDRARDSEHKPRVRYMLDSIADLKGKRRQQTRTGGTFEQLFKAVRSFVNSQKGQIKEPMRVPWKDILEADTKGRWWLTGAAWAGRNADDSTTGDSTSESNILNKDYVQNNGPSNELVEAAARQRMNTDVRRKIFYIVMGSEDYLDAFEKLIRLKLIGKQDREIIRVLVDCCLQEKIYNPYYATLGTKLCQQNHNHKFTLQFVFWDRFKDLGSLSVPTTSNLARMLAHFITEHALSLSMLKVVQFSTLAGSDLLFFQLLMVTLLTRYSTDQVSAVFERISTQASLITLKNALLLFLAHYVKRFKLGIGNGGGPADLRLSESEKSSLLRERMKLAKRWLTRSADGLS